MDIAATGRIVLLAALGFSSWGAVAGTLGRMRRDRRLAESAHRALLAAAGSTVLGLLILILALYIKDFSLSYVAGYTSRSTSRLFTLTAVWAGMEGSLLLWTSMTAIYSGTAIWMAKRHRPDLAPVATAVASAIITFFLALLAFSANPFASKSPVPFDGAGLNPLLQSPFMSIHPIMLYAGLTGFIVPFCFAISALVSGKLDPRWFTSTRRWTVFAWSMLTGGIILGGAWAYSELGWGGYWAWDPVENASLLPWLLGTAFLHSVMIQERRGMLKVWNVGLILGAYSLSIFGTFLTRSGLLSSVHTFSESPVGKYLLPLLAAILIGSFGLLGSRYDRLRSRRHLDSLLSREAAFLFNNLLFIAIAFTVLWGTIYPIVVEATSGTRISVGPPFFNAVILPVGLALFALTGIGPLIAWRRASWKILKRQFAIPATCGAAIILGLAAAGLRSAGSLTAIALSGFVSVVTVGEFVRGARAHSTGGIGGWLHGLREVVGRNKRRYGGYIVHLGVVLIFIGLSGNAFKQSWSGTVAPGSSFRIGDYSVRYDSSRNFATDEKMVNMAVLKIAKGGRDIGTLRPQRNFHFAQRQAQSEIGIRSTLEEDLYIVMTRMDSERRATFRAWVNPLVAWVWLGGCVMAVGMVIIMSARPPRRPDPASVARPAERAAVPV